MGNHLNVVACFERGPVPTLPAHDVGRPAFDIPGPYRSRISGAGIHLYDDMRVRILPPVLLHGSLVSHIFRQLKHGEGVMPEGRDPDGQQTAQSEYSDLHL